jgi:hypothetical protein
MPVCTGGKVLEATVIVSLVEFSEMRSLTWLLLDVFRAILVVGMPASQGNSMLATAAHWIPAFHDVIRNIKTRLGKGKRRGKSHARRKVINGHHYRNRSVSSHLRTIVSIAIECAPSMLRNILERSKFFVLRLLSTCRSKSRPHAMKHIQTLQIIQLTFERLETPVN